MITINDFKRLIAPIKKKIFLSLGRAVLTFVNNTEDTQKIQVIALSNETITDIERFQEYGFETYPFVDAEVFVAFLNGNRDHGIVLCTHDRRYRPTDLVEGEVINYTDEDQSAGGHRIHFKRGQIIDIKDIETIITSIDKQTETTKEKSTIATISITESTVTKTETITGSKTETIGINKIVSVTGFFTISALINTQVLTRFTNNIMLPLVGAPSPIVALGNNFTITDTTAITGFTGGLDSQVIRLVALCNVTITNSATLRLNGAVNYGMTTGDTLTLICVAAVTYYELARSVN